MDLHHIATDIVANPMEFIIMVTGVWLVIDSQTAHRNAKRVIRVFVFVFQNAPKIVVAVEKAKARHGARRVILTGIAAVFGAILLGSVLAACAFA